VYLLKLFSLSPKIYITHEQAIPNSLDIKKQNPGKGIFHPVFSLTFTPLKYEHYQKFSFYALNIVAVSCYSYMFFNAYLTSSGKKIEATVKIFALLSEMKK
jgi:hypothetical protein